MVWSVSMDAECAKVCMNVSVILAETGDNDVEHKL